jgi:ATPase subunit of ABC transporter with duplicated ATPase domains
LEAAEARAAQDPSDANLLEMERAQATWVEVGGPDAEGKVSRVLAGLGFSAQDRDKACSAFSGGWQMRIALARSVPPLPGRATASQEGPRADACGCDVCASTPRLLLSEPSLLLLDEPTNHLGESSPSRLAWPLL